MQQSSFAPNRKPKKGKIPVSVLNIISHLRISKAEVGSLVKAAKDQEWGVVDVQMVSELVAGGMDVAHAINSKDNYEVISPRIILKKSELNKTGTKFNSKTIRLMLKGKVPIEKDVFY